jgi:unsaturated rhamnogalacturonyl hydrolase
MIAAPSQADRVRTLLAGVAERTRAYDFTVWFWGDAIAIDGLLDAAELTGDAQALAHAEHFVRRWARRQLGWADHLAPGDAVLRIAALRDDAELTSAAERLAIWLTEDVPTTADGCPLYRPDLPEYRHTVWVDTLYHTPPFFSRLAHVTGDARWHDVAIGVWEAHSRALFVGDGPLLGHAYDTGRRALRGPGWGRGCGWALLGYLDTLELLPERHPQRAWAEEEARRLAARVVDLQDASGHWRTLIEDREAYLETSVAAFFGAAFAKGVRLGVFDASYEAPLEAAWNALAARIDADGGVWGVSACTYAAVNPQDDLAMYKRLPTEVNVWGQGSAMRCMAELLRWTEARTPAA